MWGNEADQSWLFLGIIGSEEIGGNWKLREKKVWINQHLTMSLLHSRLLRDTEKDTGTTGEHFFHRLWFWENKQIQPTKPHSPFSSHDLTFTGSLPGGWGIGTGIDCSFLTWPFTC
jgi:hypothetical protein